MREVTHSPSPKPQEKAASDDARVVVKNRLRTTAEQMKARLITGRRLPWQERGERWILHRRRVVASACRCRPCNKASNSGETCSRQSFAGFSFVGSLRAFAPAPYPPGRARRSEKRFLSHAAARPAHTRTPSGRSTGQSEYPRLWGRGAPVVRATGVLASRPRDPEGAYARRGESSARTTPPSSGPHSSASGDRGVPTRAVTVHVRSQAAKD